MGEEILVAVTAVETRVAVIADGLLQDLYIERASSPGISGNIYLGKVVRVLRGTQSAFVDIGEDRTAFIHVSDVFELGADGQERPATSPDIGDLLQQGQPLLVQVSKEPLGGKGARLTTRISLSSDYLVYLPRASHRGISRQIKNNDERSRLRSQLDAAVRDRGASAEGGYIIRSAAQETAPEALQSNLDALNALWQVIVKRLQTSATPALLYQVPPLYQRAIRDLVGPGLQRICVNDREVEGQLHTLFGQHLRELAVALEVHDDMQSLFDRYAVDDEIKRGLSSRVDLAAGGYLVIEQTEALTTVDVNAGSCVGSYDPEQTIYEVNLEAATALARQLRLRNLGGIVVVDFIDMGDVEHRRGLLRVLQEVTAGDSAQISIGEVSALGLVEISRERTRQSLTQVLCEPCPSCNGMGTIKSVETVCYEIFREILRDAHTSETDTLRVLAGQEVVDRLLQEDAGSVAGLEKGFAIAIEFCVEPDFSREQFELIWH
jgi:ribonuclease G